MRDPAAVLLDAASQTAAALSGHPLVVTASVLSRTMSEALSARLVTQADDLLHHLLPVEAPHYAVRRTDERGWQARPVQAVRAGDRVRLGAGSVVPVDGRVVRGSATLVAPVHHAALAPRTVAAGEPSRQASSCTRARSNSSPRAMPPDRDSSACARTCATPSARATRPGAWPPRSSGWCRCR